MAALRFGVGIAIALLGIGWAAWRSGDRPPVDEVAIAEARLGIDLESRNVPTGAAATPTIGNTRSIGSQMGERGYSCEDERPRTGSTSLVRRRPPVTAASSSNACMRRWRRFRDRC